MMRARSIYLKMTWNDMAFSSKNRRVQFKVGGRLDSSVTEMSRPNFLDTIEFRLTAWTWCHAEK